MINNGWISSDGIYTNNPGTLEVPVAKSGLSLPIGLSNAPRWLVKPVVATLRRLHKQVSQRLLVVEAAVSTGAHYNGANTIPWGSSWTPSAWKSHSHIVEAMVESYIHCRSCEGRQTWRKLRLRRCKTSFNTIMAAHAVVMRSEK